MGIGERLKEERERLGFSQTEFAAVAGASKNSQYNYEKGERSPDAAYLAAVAEKRCRYPLRRHRRANPTGRRWVHGCRGQPGKSIPGIT